MSDSDFPRFARQDTEEDDEVEDEPCPEGDYILSVSAAAERLSDILRTLPIGDDTPFDELEERKALLLTVVLECPCVIVASSFDSPKIPRLAL